GVVEKMLGGDAVCGKKFKLAGRKHIRGIALARGITDDCLLVERPKIVNEFKVFHTLEGTQPCRKACHETHESHEIKGIGQNQDFDLSYFRVVESRTFFPRPTQS